jgi:hypothetical protein
MAPPLGASIPPQFGARVGKCSPCAHNVSAAAGKAAVRRDCACVQRGVRRISRRGNGALSHCGGVKAGPQFGSLRSGDATLHSRHSQPQAGHDERRGACSFGMQRAATEPPRSGRWQ